MRIAATLRVDQAHRGLGVDEFVGPAHHGGEDLPKAPALLS